MAQQAGDQTNRGAQIGALAEQLRWQTPSGRKHYESEKTELTRNVLLEVDQYITETFVPGSATAEQVQSGLNDLLGYTKGLGIQNVAFLANLPKGEFLIVGVELWRGGAAISEDYLCFRAYAGIGGKFMQVASTGDLSDSRYLDDLHAGALQPPAITGEFWFVSWADIPPQSPYTIAIRLYAFDGKKFRTVWAPQNIIAAGIDTAVQVGPSGSVFTLNQIHTWASQSIVHEQFAVSANGPKKVKEWKSAR